MIEGLKIRVRSDELKLHCAARAKYHETRANEKEAKLPELRRSLETIRETTSPQGVSNMFKGSYHIDTSDPVEDLEHDIRDHRNKSLVFTFFAEHFFDDDYCLKEDDLVRLEILKR